MSDNTLLQYFFLPVIYLVIGLLIPQCKNIGPVGYRTPRSMKNQENWDFSQKLSGQLLFRLGILMLIINTLFYFSVLPLSYFKQSEITLIAGGSILIIIYTEMRLYRFEKNRASH